MQLLHFHLIRLELKQIVLRRFIYQHYLDPNPLS